MSPSVKAADFVSYLGLEGAKVHTLPLDTWLAGVFEFADHVWENPDLDQFVDHGLDHSWRIVRRALEVARQLLPGTAQLSSLEKALLGVASMIHDIGMQYRKYVKLDKGLSDQHIRSTHCGLGAEMVEKALTEERVSLGLPCFPTRFGYEYLVSYAKLVAFSHCSRSGMEYWTKVQEHSEGLPKREGEQMRRLSLLAGLLRLGDELDQDFNRIQDPNRLFSRALDVESKAHWLACYYVREVRVGGGAGDIRIVLEWRAPVADDEADLVRSLLKELREQHMNRELQIVVPSLRHDCYAEAPLYVARVADSPERDEKIQRLPEAVRGFVRDKLRPYQYGVKQVPSYSNLKEFRGDSAVEFCRTRADEFIRGGEGVVSQHFVLTTGWHTDKYVRCRDLVADIAFADKLTSALAKKFAPSHILAIGTSAIRLGALLAVKLGVEFQYAYGGIHVTSGVARGTVGTASGQYVKVPRGAKVLVIDDILGVGSVLARTAALLSEIGVESMIAFCIYSLGHMKEIMDSIPNMEVYYLVAFPDVQYWQGAESDRVCENCKETPEIRRFESVM